MEEVDNIQEQTCYVRMEMETLRRNQKKMLEIKNTVTETKKAFNRFISRLDMAEETISEF